ncbi:DUF3955 domain-containing protein [Siminovitchia sp. FSL H7-0308]|uniref:DUF3955 domain-containing protein n=1 Tax=Siminovitchia thermophila TaxID=1245522 RepID=A0ABS2R2W0_9BACI|nr:DUF3955 domain-containing protein [Siminovitchia thermophila]MBM7713972.1 hypothetical protein [Siminovitchia thermophila]ONK23853.1 group-specific protein [Bacillus sp. VT-16-64]
MKKRFLLALLPIVAGVICLISYEVIGAEVEADGTLKEPFFLIPISFLLLFSGIAALLFVTIVTAIQRGKHD